MIAAIGHDRYAEADYRQLQRFGIRTVRDGFRWHLIEQSGDFDWSSARPMLRAAANTATQVIWDLPHYGWPDGLDIWSSRFVDRFARFASACARLVRRSAMTFPFIVPSTRSRFSPGRRRRGLFEPFCQRSRF